MQQSFCFPFVSGISKKEYQRSFEDMTRRGVAPQKNSTSANDNCFLNTLPTLCNRISEIRNMGSRCEKSLSIYGFLPLLHISA